jgi:hypothetical protein
MPMFSDYSSSSLLSVASAAASVAASAAGRLYLIAPGAAKMTATRSAAIAVVSAVPKTAAAGVTETSAAAITQDSLGLTAVATGLAVAASQAPQLGLPAVAIAPVVASILPEAMFALVLGGCAAAWRHATTSKTSSADATADASVAPLALSSVKGAAVSTVLWRSVPQARAPAPAMFFGGGRSKPKPKAAKGAKKASPTKPIVTGKAKPLSPGSNYPTTKNIQTQANGFGTFMQKFEFASATKKSKYGMPVFLPNGNVNPAYLKAERDELEKKKRLNIKATEAKRKNLIKNKQFELADYIRKKIGEVGSNSDYYKSGR